MQTFLKLIVVILLLVGFSSCSTTQSLESEDLRTYDIAELDKLIGFNDRPIALFVHADWCTYCRNMEQTTFKNAQVKSKLNTDFYFISFDGESKKDVRFQNKTYQFNPHGARSGTHELATKLATIDNQVSYPTFLIIDTDGKTPVRYNTFLSPMSMEEILATAVSGQE